MTIKVNIDGSGSIGDITPGWSAQEYATPIIPGDTSGGTGTVAFTAAAKQDSLFLVNTTVTSSELQFSEARRNLCTNPSFNGSIDGWAIGSNITAEYSTDYAYAGTGSMLITKSVLGNSNSAVSVTVDTVVGEKYAVSAYIRNNAGDTSPFVFAGTNQSTPILVTASWVRHQLVFTATGSQTVVGINAGTATAPLSSFYLDAVLIEHADAVYEYFDGDAEGGSHTKNVWQSIPGASQSVQLAGVGLGEITGVVKSVSQTGGTVSVSHGTSLTIFDANFDIPALGAGGMLPVIDIASQLSGRDKICLSDTGRVYTMTGHSAGFDKAGVLVKPEYRGGSYGAYNNGTGQFYTAYFTEQYGSVWGDKFEADNGNVYATHIIGDAFSNNPATNVSRLAFKAQINSGLTWDFVASPDDSNVGGGQGITVSVQPNGILDVTGRYRYAGIAKDFSATSNLAASFDVTKELVFFIEYRRPKTAQVSDNEYTFTLQICGDGSFNAPVVIEQVFNADHSKYFEPWESTGKIRDVYRDQGYELDPWVPAEYAATSSYIYSSTIELDGPIPAQVDANLWTYMQDACTVYEKEIAAIDGEVIVRDIDTINLDINNHSQITITPSIVLSGRNVEINYSNAKHVANAELYNAYKDNNRVISVKAAETVKTTVTIDGNISSINLPTYSESPISGVGQYKISDSKGNPVPIKLWNDNGGRLNLALVDGQPNAIEITFIAPTTTDGTFNAVTGDSSKPLYPGPYKLAYTADGTDYAALSITGTGITTTDKTLKLRTAADETKTAQDVAKTINSPFILSKSQAYDRGLLAAIDASGPRVTISGTVSVNDVNGFGLTAGSRIRYMDSIYRVTDVNYNSIGVSFNASRHVKVSDFDTFWDGRTVGTHDTLWAGFDASDHAIKPLWFIGDNEEIILMLDTDGNPYYAFTGIPEISVLFDTDGNPYYIDGYEENAEPVYLDTDSNPYV